ncbi:MAG TPA: HEAT repeat domain-containing protein, partial [Gemmataceae bacterium]|nr:HEAT repeat domain-containing protein [Gemmataceae bacterium]
MTRRALLTATVACFLVAAPATRCLTGPEPTQQQRKAPPSERAIAEWIRQLSDDHFAVREAAQRALVEAGPPALPAVRAAARSGDAEVRRRAAAILQAIGAQIASRKPAVKVPLADAKTQVELHQSLALRLYYLDRAKAKTDLHRRSFRDHEDFVRLQPELAMSEAHVQYALWWKPGIAGLPCLKGRKDPVAWLRKNLAAEILPDGATLLIRWKGPDIPEANFVVRAVADVYVEDSKDACYYKRAWRLTNLESQIKGAEGRIATREKMLADGRYEAHSLPSVRECQKNEREYIKTLHEQAEALRRGDNPPPLYIEYRAGPVRLKSPKDGKTD